ncbi:NAD(P)H-quinone oxidoreductase [Brevibacterium otitidis]|uniref:NAD(P)H-quinone oxidoreductase n=1 Tax=Brevibacterium otitidis TaxID=53364 RepID=A0ABV5X3Z6_9MICO|nr:NAD(P)H-quinone oxidoreductase [Brevibacterium otitidis]
MRAMTIPQPGGPEALVLADDVEAPVPGPDSVLVRVDTAGINRADILQRQGHYDPPAGATRIPGLEVSGTIESVGSAVTDWQPGDRVAALLTGGGYAEFVDVPAGQLLPVPDDFDLTAAAALPEVMSTVYSNVVMEAGLRAGEWLLVHGGGSGIGTCAIQLARALGARVAVTVGSERKAAFCRELGADAVINYREEDFVSRIREITAADPAPGPAGEPGTPGANVILDLIGAKYLERNIKALANDGRLVIIGMQGGVKAEINLARLLTGRKHVLGTTLRARPDAQKAQIGAAVREHVWPLVLDGTIRPVIHDTIPLAEAGRGQSMLEDGDSIGKVLLRVADAAPTA